mmetsp:Transcript_35274/g.94471  ORF Transcript_35274/g.94471 Transcript_35274/m.94471 type:complete len:179 (-) Transcript_35274:110-646(-)
MAAKDAKLSFKYIVIGNTSVGKSCLMLQFIDKRFQPVHDLTIGIEYGQRNVTVKGRSVNLQIYDTAGQENFRSIIRAYYRGAAGGLLVFDITKRKSFNQIEDWLAEVKRSANPNIVLILVGNKADIASQRTVSEEEARSVAKRHGLVYIEASAKTGLNVDAAFERVAEGIIDKINRYI